MSYSNQIELPARRQQVWDSLLDPQVMQACMPGCEALEWINDSQLAGRVKIGFGPFGFTVDGELALSNVIEPVSYTLTGRGATRFTSSAAGQAEVVLADRGATTVLRYTASATIETNSGGLASGLMDSVAAKLADTFFKRLSDHLAQSGKY
jgi:hypothetical protein